MVYNNEREVLAAFFLVPTMIPGLCLFDWGIDQDHMLL